MAAYRSGPMKLGKLGVWAGLDGMSAADALAFARRIEKRGYSALWTPESRGRNVLVNAAWLLAGTSTPVVASGLANIYARDSMAMAKPHRGLTGQSGNRFLLVLVVPHKPIRPRRAPPGARRWRPIFSLRTMPTTGGASDSLTSI